MSKRRTENFTTEEKDVLLGLVSKNKNVLENKRTDQTTTKQKEDCWNKLAVELNNEFPQRKRTGIQLKQCWNNIKKHTKKNAAELRRSQFQTGGGAPSALSLTEVDERVLALVPSQIRPLPNSNDSDAKPAEASTSVSVMLTSEDHVEETSCCSSDHEKTSDPVPKQRKPSASKKDAATDEFVKFYRLKNENLKRKMEIQEDEASLRKKCLQKELEIKEKEFELKTFQLNQLKGKASQGNFISSVYETLS